MHSDLTAEFRNAIIGVLPIVFLIMVLGLVLTFVGKRIENALVRFIRGRRGLRTSRKPAAPKTPQHAGVLEAPACPQCGSKMVLREAHRGANAGQSFWGCSRYPACRGTRPC
jgi:hypothetical protein